MMRSDKGTYAIIFQCLYRGTKRVGQWGMISLKEGYYVYIGSAFGPGGVKARVLRHCRTPMKPHWHIDYLRRFLRPIAAYHTYDHRRLEHQWAKVFYKMNSISSFRGFGCSDCGCYSHLYFTLEKPEPAVFLNALAGDIEIEFLNEQAVQLEGVKAQHGKPDEFKGSRANGDQRTTEAFVQSDN